MIEKIIRAVKSSNKKRGRNITIGVVVGMLLSCTTIMGKDVVGLEITKDEDEIIFKDKDGTPFIPGKEKDPHPDNEWDGNTYINNSTIFAETTSGDNVIGLKLSDNLKINLTNNGVITGSGSYSGYGIDINSLTGNLTNNGVITGSGSASYIGIDISTLEGNLTNNGEITDSGSSYGYGIHISTLEGNLTNNGGITGSGSSHGYGIGITYLTRNLTNNGGITGSGSSYCYGIIINSLTGNLTNKGAIRGSGFGIVINSLTGNLTNTGVVYGKTNAIQIANTDTTKSAYNYGILVTDGSKAVEGLGKKLTSYGLIIKNANDGSVTVEAGDVVTGPIDVIVGYKRTVENGIAKDIEIKRKLTIKNAEITNGTESAEGVITGKRTESFKFSGGGTEYDNSILNGMDDTLEISEADVDREVKGSIINAYGNAVVFNNSFDRTLTLSGTIVNGGIKDDTYAILGSKTNNDTLILEGAEVEYIDPTDEDQTIKKFQQTIINSDINMQDGNNTVTLKNGSVVNGSITTGEGSDTFTIENGSQINGILEGGTGDDTLTFEKNVIAKSTSNSDEIRIQHNISNFENINVNSNVTFFESTANYDGTAKALEVTGVNNLTIGKNGVLTLRIDRANGNSHALSSNTETGTIKSEEGGKFLLALNGAGLNTKISFGNLELDKSLVTGYEGKYQEDVTFETTSVLHSVKRTLEINEVEVEAKKNLPSIPSGFDDLSYEKLNKIYHSILSVEDLLGNFNVDDDEKLSTFLGYLNDIYAGSPYSYSSELSRKSAGMFRDIVTDNQFKADTGKWMIYGGLTHVDGGTKDTYYGKGYYTYDIGSSDMDADTKITGAYMLGEYGVSDTLTSGIVIGGNKLKSDLSNGSKVDGSALYLGAYAKKYVGNLKVTAGAGFQYGDYDADRLAVNKVASSTGESVMKYSDNYNDITYDIYLNGRYSHNIGDNLFLEPYATLSYTYVDQDGANEGSKALAIETDSKSFDYTVGKVGVDLKKVILHEKGKSTLTAGVSYTKILEGADEEYITGRFKGGSDFDILVAHKNEHNIGLNAKYALELESGVLFDVKGTYSVERDSHNGSGKNKTKGEWIAGAGMGYKF